MAHESALTQSSNLKDGEESVTEADLEEGEIEDEELPEEGEVQAPDDPPCIPKASQSPQVPVAPLPVKKERRAPLLPRPPRRHAPQNLRRHATPRIFRERQSINNESENEEDDWASNVEKALKAALAGSEATAGPSVTSAATGEAETKSSVLNENEEKDGNKSSSDDERKPKKRKRKKKHREDADEDDNKRDLKKHRKLHHKDMWEEKDEQGDEDEMLFVRGASPNMRNNYSEGSPSRSFGENSFYPDQGVFDETYDSFHEEGSDFESRDDFPIRSGGGGRGSEDDGLRHGVGRGGKRRMRGGPLGRGGEINQRGAHHHHGKRMLQNRKDGNVGKNAGKLRGGIRRMGGRDNRSDICMFYLQGKCHKGADCPYSHNMMPARKNELCKFYLKDCCAKKDKCLYLHEAFPCKYFHMGMKCYQGDQCKFSHGPLSNQMKHILMKHIETSPKDQLSDYQRGSRDSNSSSSYNRRRDNERSERPERNDRERERDKEKERERGDKVDKGEKSEKSERGERSSGHRSGSGSSKRGSRSIPSLFDIEVPIHVQRLVERKDADEDSPARRSTPMPDSENEDGIDTPILSTKSETKSSKNKENRWVSDNSQSSGHNRDFNGEKTPDRKCETKSQNEGDKPVFRFYQDTLSSDEGEYRKRDDRRRKREHKSRRESHHKRSKHSPDSGASDICHKSKGAKKTLTDEDTTASDEKQSTSKQDFPEEKILHSDVLSELRDSQAETGESGTESNDGTNIPLHLPKKQRELFLRIQQQQREADSSQDRSEDNEEDEDNCADENWYSSDEEDVPLTDLLKKLSNQAPQKQQVTQSESGQNNITSTPSTESTPTIVPTVSGLTLKDLSQIDISESVTKLLTTIRNQGVIPSTTAAPTTAMTTSITSSGLTSMSTVSVQTPERISVTTTVQSPQQQGSPAIRDPRVSRDPRNRTPATAATSTATLSAPVTTGPQGLLSPGSCSNSNSAEVPIHPARRPDPRTVRTDPRKAAAVGVTSVGASPSSDDSHSKNAAGPPPRRASFTSIYSNAITSPGDVDLRSLPHISTTTAPSTSTTGDVDLRHAVDTDLRQIAGFSGGGDTDLRPRISADSSSALSGDIDLRRVLELPFKPVPMHTPATEIDASLTSHPPIPYKVVEITIPRPDYTRLKLSTADPQVENDPRLRKIFKLPELPVTTSSSKTSTSFSPSVPRTDPRRMANTGSVSTVTTSVKSTVSHSSVTVTNSAVTHTTEPLSLGIQTTPFGSLNDASVPPVGMVMPGVGTVANVDPRVPRTAPVSCRPGLLGVAPPGFPVASNPAMAVGMRMPYFPMDEGDGSHWNPLQPQQPRPAWRGMRRNVTSGYSEQDLAGGQTFTPPL